MAYHPSWIDKVKFIVRWFSVKCETPWIVYFETSAPAAGRAILTLLSFGTDDVIRGFFRPKNLRSGRHGRKPKKGKPGKPVIPEIGEIAAKQIPGQEVIAERKVSQGVKNLWLIDNQGQRALYYWMIIDVLTSFIYDWLSGIMKDPASNCGTLGRALRRGPTRPALHTNGSFRAFTNTNLIYEHGPILINAAGGVIGEGIFFTSSSATFHNSQATPCTVELLVVANKNGETVSGGHAGPITFAPGETVDLIASGDVKGPATLNSLIKLNLNTRVEASEWLIVEMGDGW